MAGSASIIFLLIATSLCLSLAQVDNTENEINRKDSQVGLIGDVRFTPAQQQVMTGASRSQFGLQNAVLDPDIFEAWEGATVPYVLDPSLNNDGREAIMDAIEEYETRTCIRFRVRTNELDYVRFFVDNGCYSYIGKIGGMQEISIGRGCESVGIVIHEIFHALGRFHEQSRPDRDLYVRINSENILSRFESNFDIADDRFVITQGVEYDFGSVMHYSAYGFSSNGQPTIEPLAGQGIGINDLGQRDGFSARDIIHANILYCGQELGTWGNWNSWSTCSRTCNGGTRSRTRQCSTDACEGNSAEIEDCNTNVGCVTAPTWSSWTSWSLCTATCGGGTRTRQRTCQNGNTCAGVASQSENCNNDECEQAAEWSSWGSWGSCSQTCGDGTQRRNRRCLNGDTCQPGFGFETRACNDMDCSPDDGEWSQWSACTETCGTEGTRTRTRNCGLEDTSLCDRESEACNRMTCPEPETNLRGIRRIGCYLVPIFASPLVLLEGLTPDLSDNPFIRVDPISKCGTAAVQLDYEAFALTERICISGSSALRNYQTTEADSFCNNGIGGYAFGYYFMDVYELYDIPDFANSAGFDIMLPEPSPSPSPEYSPDGVSMTFPSVILLSLTVLMSVYYILFNN